jgi:2-hydroxychromene-2-carboxylate isomerase
MKRKIIFYLDFISPFAYLANVKLPGIAVRYAAAIEYRPIDVMHAKLAAGNFAPSTRNLPAKARFIGRDRRSWAERYGVPMNDPKGARTERLNIGVYHALDRGCAQQYVDAAFHRVRGLGQGPDDDAVLAGVAADLGWETQSLLDFVHSPQAQARYREGQQQAARLGVFGVPMLIVDDQMFWGNDRLDFLEEYLAQAGTAYTMNEDSDQPE